MLLKTKNKYQEAREILLITKDKFKLVNVQSTHIIEIK